MASFAQHWWQWLACLNTAGKGWPGSVFVVMARFAQYWWQWLALLNTGGNG
jgi:hypothetical protein